MKIFARSIISIALAAAASNTMAMQLNDDVKFIGDFRSGVFGSDANDIPTGNVQKAKLGRFGNEFDTWVEFGFQADTYKVEDKKTSVNVVVNGYEDSTNLGGDGMSVGWEMINAHFTNWLGKGEDFFLGYDTFQKGPYYMGMTDHFYWNTNNVGGGFSSMKVGNGNLNMAILQKRFNDGFISTSSNMGVSNEAVLAESNQFDALYKDLPVWSGGSMDFAFKYIDVLDTVGTYEELANDDSVAYDGLAQDGHVAMIQLNQQLANGGVNKTVVQYYGEGSAMQGVTYGSADNVDARVQDGWGYALRNYGTIKLSPEWQLDHVINFAQAKDVTLEDTADTQGYEGDASSIAINAKLAYIWSERTRTVLDAGYFADEADTQYGDFDRDGSKIALGQVFTFPMGEVRLYGSYLEADNSNWTDTASSFSGDEDNEFVVGAQLDVGWW